MDVRLLTSDPLTIDTAIAELLVVLVPMDQSRWRLSKGVQSLLAEAITAGDLSLKVGKSLYLHRPAGLRAARLLAIVVGTDGAKAVHAAGLAALAQSRGGAPRAWTVVDGSDTPMLDVATWCESLVRTVHDGAYVYRHTKPSADAAALPKRLNLLVPAKDLAAARSGVARGVAIAAGVDVAKECANRPANHCTPSDLAQRARDLGRSHGFGVEVLDRKAVEKLKMGAFLSVANGSPEPLKFIVMRYEGADKKQAPLVLVGKGITFDTGGISIKPAAGMDEMKFDMGGAASVLGTFRAIGELKPRINVIGLIPTCENMPSGTATRPGDVVTAMSGLTIEVLNTDAEGRLILCDALTYAERFKPAAVVDIATLTGACVVALGHHRSGLFCADESLAQELNLAGQTSLDPAWRMPLDEEYAAGLKSHFADMGNVGPREGGAIAAAMFLKRFTQAYPWAHLDIAGTAWRSGAAKGATGRPVPLLTSWVLSRADAAQAGPKVTAKSVGRGRRVPRTAAPSGGQA